MSDLNWLKQTIYHYYGIEVISANKVRDAWRLNTTAGQKCFKHTDLSPDNVQFVATAVDYLLNNGFAQTVPFIKTIENCVSVDLPEGIYYMTKWIPGREGRVNSLQDACDAASTLAKLHMASRGFTPPPNCKSRVGWGRLPADWLSHTTELEQYSVEFQKQQPQDPFTKLFLATANRYIARCKLAIEILQTCNYAMLVQEAKHAGSLCHKDFTYHNFIIDSKGILNIIDFDYCTQDIRSYDIGRYTRKIARHFEGQTSPIGLMLHAYNSVSKLSNNELIFILAFVYFPQRYWRIVNRYYSNPDGDKDSLYKQLQHETGTLNKEEAFLAQFSMLINQGILLGGS